MATYDIITEPPMVSIIITTYNDGLLVCEAIESSLGQTYKNIEIIVVDDGSTDDTGKIIKKKYKDRILYVYQENKGPGSARNTGIRISSGKYLQFLDSDDLLDKEKLSLQIKLLKTTHDKALSYCDYIYCDLDDITKTYNRTTPFLNTENPFDDIMMKWETQVSIPIHCFIFDSALFKENGIFFDEKLRANEDWQCWMDLFGLHPKVIFIDKALAYYRMRQSSRCRDRGKMRKAWIISINNQIEKFRTNKQIVQKLNLRKKQILYVYRDASPINKIIDKSPAVFRLMYDKLIPWRIQRMFD